MKYRRIARATLSGGLVLGLFVAAMSAGTPQGKAPLTLGSGRLSIAGTSNVHDYKASTTALRVTRLQLAARVAADAPWDEVTTPGALEAFEIAIAANTLKSGKDGLDKNMYKALNTAKYPDITFRLIRVQPGAVAGSHKATGILSVAGTEREVTLDLTTEPKDTALVIRGELPIVMTDYGITPPKAMLGVIKTDPKVTVAFEIALAPANTAATR